MLASVTERPLPRSARTDFFLWILALALLLPVNSTVAIAQTPSPDSTGAGPKLSVHAGLSAQSIDTDQPAGRYGSVGLTWQLSRFIALDVGARAGLSPGAPSLGITAGLSTAIITR